MSCLIPLLMEYASLSGQAMHYLKYMLLINTYYVMGAAVNTTLIAGPFSFKAHPALSFYTAPSSVNKLSLVMLFSHFPLR